MRPFWRGAKPRPATVMFWPASAVLGEIERLGPDVCAASGRISSGKSTKGRSVAAQSLRNRDSFLEGAPGPRLARWPDDEVMLVPSSRSFLQVELGGY